MTFNLTAKRLRALRMIQQRPGLLARALTEVCDATGCGTDANWTGFSRSRTGSQGATRWGAAYAKKLADAGLVEVRTHTDKRGAKVTCGFAALYLTALGEEVARTGQMPAQ